MAWHFHLDAHCSFVWAVAVLSVLLNIHEVYLLVGSPFEASFPQYFPHFVTFRPVLSVASSCGSLYSSLGSQPQEHCCTDCLSSCHRVPARGLAQTDGTQHKLHVQHYFFFIHRKNLKACSVPTTTV